VTATLPLVAAYVIWGLVVADESKTFEHGEINFWGALKAASNEFSVFELTLDDLLALQYTSGSTGRPKGAMLVHKTGLILLPHLLYAMDVRADDVFWGGADPGWAYGLFACLTDPLVIGKAAILIESPFTPELAWQVMERYGVTNFTHAPTAY